MTDTIEQHISASPQICERVIASLKMHNGSTVSNLSYFSGYSRIIVIDALEQMERRGAVRHEMARWFVIGSIPEISAAWHRPQPRETSHE